jgi:hypothetical protein
MTKKVKGYLKAPEGTVVVWVRVDESSLSDFCSNDMQVLACMLESRGVAIGHTGGKIYEGGKLISEEYFVSSDKLDYVTQQIRLRGGDIMIEFVAVLSTTVLPLDGIYSIRTVSIDAVNVAGVPHYVGHPDTKAIVESLGAVQAPSKLFPGLQPGEKAVCFPIQQGKSTRKDEGFTNPHQSVTLDDLQVRVIERLDEPPKECNPVLRIGG